MNEDIGYKIEDIGVVPFAYIIMAKQMINSSHLPTRRYWREKLGVSAEAISVDVALCQPRHNLRRKQTERGAGDLREIETKVRARREFGQRRAEMNLQPMSEAPRDGTHVMVFERHEDLSPKGYPGGPIIRDPKRTVYLTATEARVVPSWVTAEFIPAYIPDDDTSGLNHGALPEHLLIGWSPMPECADSELPDSTAGDGPWLPGLGRVALDRPNHVVVTSEDHVAGRYDRPLNDLDYMEILINACHGATEVAEIAARLKDHCDYLTKECGAPNERLDQAYAVLRAECAELAGIGHWETTALDTAIAMFLESEEIAAEGGTR